MKTNNRHQCEWFHLRDGICRHCKADHRGHVPCECQPFRGGTHCHGCGLSAARPAAWADAHPELVTADA